MRTTARRGAVDGVFAVLAGLAAAGLIGLIGLAAAQGNPVATTPFEAAPEPSLTSATFTVEPGVVIPPEPDPGGSWLGLIIVGLLLATVLTGLIAVVVWAVRAFVARRGRLHRRVLEPDEISQLVSPFADVDLAGLHDPVRGAVSSGLALVVQGSDVRAAILEAWIRLEEAAAASGVPSQEADAPADLVTRLLAERDVRAYRLERLAELYRRARFSDVELTESDRRQAAQALADVLADLTGPRVAAAGQPDEAGRWPTRW